MTRIPAPFTTPRMIGFSVLSTVIVPIIIKQIPEIVIDSSKSLNLLYDFFKHQNVL